MGGKENLSVSGSLLCGRDTDFTDSYGLNSPSTLRAKPSNTFNRSSPPRLPTLPASVALMKLDLPALESWLWEAACVIRGPVDAPKFKDYILPLIFLKRLSDAFEDEIRDMEAEIVLGDTMTNPRFTRCDGSLRRFDRVTSNLMWNQKFAASQSPCGRGWSGQCRSKIR